MKEVLKAFWDDLNTPEDFADQPAKGAANQVGHIAIGGVFTTGICSVWVQVFGYGALTWPIVVAVATVVVLFYLVVIELGRQKWAGQDTVEDAGFVALGAALPAAALDMTPSGRWIRTDQGSLGFLIWLACAVIALALYVYPRAKRKSDLAAQGWADLTNLSDGTSPSDGVPHEHEAHRRHR